MKKQGNRKTAYKSSKTKRSTKNKTMKYKPKKSLKKGNMKRQQKVKLIRKSKKKMGKKYNKKVMKGGSIPFSELNPSTVLEHTMYGVKGMLSGSLIDNADYVPNNLPHNVNPSVMDQPYLDTTTGDSLNVAGDSPNTHFAPVS